MKSFEENLQRLEEISRKIRSSEITLQETTDLFEEGMNLSKALEEELQTIEQKVEILVSSDDQEGPAFTPFDGVTQ